MRRPGKLKLKTRRFFFQTQASGETHVFLSSRTGPTSRANRRVRAELPAGAQCFDSRSHRRLPASSPGGADAQLTGRWGRFRGPKRFWGSSGKKNAPKSQVCRLISRGFSVKTCRCGVYPLENASVVISVSHFWGPFFVCHVHLQGVLKSFAIEPESLPAFNSILKPGFIFGTHMSPASIVVCQK